MSSFFLLSFFKKLKYKCHYFYIPFKASRALEIIDEFLLSSVFCKYFILKHNDPNTFIISVTSDIVPRSLYQIQVQRLSPRIRDRT